MNWNTVVGSTGKLRIIVDTYKKKDGTDGQTNRVDKYYEPANNATTSNVGGWTPGAF